MKEIQINLFKINVDALINDNNLKKIYYYQVILNEEEGEKTFHKLKHYGNVEDKDKKIISTIFPPNKSELKLISEEILDKSKITKNHIEGYLRYSYGLSKKLSLKFKEIYIENYSITPYVRFNILKEKDDFYLILNFRYRIHLIKSMLETGFKEGDKFIFMCNNYKNCENCNNGVHEVIKVLQNDKNEIKNIEKKLKERHKISDKINYEQKIIWADNDYPYLPQFCYKVFNFSDVKGTEISRKIMEKIRISNKDRMKKIIEIIKDLLFIEKEPLKISYKKLQLPKLIVRDKEGNEKKIKATNEIFKSNYYPYENPLKGKTLKTYVIISNFNLKSEAQDLLNELKERYEINFDSIYLEFKDKILDEIPKANDDFGLAIIFGTSNYKELKVGLLDKNYISQFVDIKTIKSRSWEHAKRNIIFQIAHKIGIRYFALESKNPYDYIIGFDVSRKENVNLGGCAVIYDSSGILKTIVPITIPQGGEKINIRFIIEKLKNKNHIELKNRKLLILRDGPIYEKDELEKLNEISKDYNCEILIIGIIKRHNIYINNNKEYGIYLNFANSTFLLPHKTNSNNEKPLKIEQAYLIKNGQINEEFKLNEEIIKILYDLTRLNYSSLNYEGMSIKCPAPIHYVDKFLNFIHLSKEGYEEFLKKGFLYFI